MKKKFYILIAAIIFAGSLISATLNSGGSPGGKTNSPLDGNNCSQCHTGSVTPADNWISSNIPGTGYIPGNTYTITASGDHSGALKFGFELTAEDASAKVGTFVITNATETQLTNGDASVTHTASGNTPSGGSKTWNFDWTAPVAGTGNITFFGAFNAANNDGATSGDVIYTSSLSINEDLGSGIEENNSNTISVAPNPVNDILTVNSDDIIHNISFFDISGKQILNLKDVQKNRERIDISQFSKGIYFIKIEGVNFKKIEKVMIN